MNKTRSLLRMIGSPLLDQPPECEFIESDELFGYAFRNNIEMLYLQALADHGKLDLLKDQGVAISSRQRRTLETVCRLSSVLQNANIPHAITKTLRPYPGTPNDIDCLYLGRLDEYDKAGKYLQENNYRLTGPDPMQSEFFDELSGEEFKEDKAGGQFYIDFYSELAADHMPYMDSAILIKHVIDEHVDGCDKPVKVLEAKAELVVLSLHSVLMHRIVPLEVFYTYSHVLAQMNDQEIAEVWNFTRLNHAEPAMRTVLSLMETLYRDCFDVVPVKLQRLIELSGRRNIESTQLAAESLRMPHVVQLSTFVITVFSKIRGARARRGFFKELLHMLNPVFAVEVLYHMLSRKYIDKHSDHV